MNKQICINELTATFRDRLDYLICIEDYDSASAIHSEFVVGGIEPKDNEYIWLFVERMKDIIR